MRDDSNLPASPDFIDHPLGPPIAAVSPSATGLRIDWADGVTMDASRFWLRENEVAADIVDPETRERVLRIADVPDNLAIAGAEIEPEGAVRVIWEPDHRQSRFHPGWLRHTAEGGWRPQAGLPARESWTAARMPELPTFDGPGVLDDDAALKGWLGALYRYGIARLVDVPLADGTVERVARRIGTIRASNFGFLFTVESKPDPDSTAYTGAALEGHTDLASREVQPGIQMLHCQENTSEGGASTMVDGFAVAEAIRAEDPEAFGSLVRDRWLFSNRHPETDFRWSGPLVETDIAGNIVEIRNTGFLRANPDMESARVEIAYKAVRLFAERAAENRFTCRSRFRAGDLVAFDNRRILHGRDSFDPRTGSRRLQGCYLETDELLSRLRVLNRP
ncbi:MAG: TauD/TfdA family dioxygenase [Pseudomonadota bacterium]